MSRVAPRSTLFPYTTLFRSAQGGGLGTRRHPSGSERIVGLEHGPEQHRQRPAVQQQVMVREHCRRLPRAVAERSEEHTSELQSLTNLVCRLLLEKKKKNKKK